MVWFNVDDGLTTSPKVLSIPRDVRLQVMGLWVMAGSWCGQHLTDGEVPEFMLAEWGADVSHGTALVDAGLWRKTARGYRFHAWDEYQQSRADVEAKREHDRARKQAYREKVLMRRQGVPEGQTGDNAGTDSGIQAESSPPIPTLPSPTKPTLLSDEAAKRGRTIPDPFMVTLDMRAWAAEKAPLVQVDQSTERFVDYWRAKTGKDATKKDWIATWRNWLRNDQERAEQRGPRRATPTDRAMATIALGQQQMAVGS